jgi:hypothetical protein
VTSIPLNSRCFVVAVIFGSALFLATSAASAAFMNYNDAFEPVSGTLFSAISESSGTDPVPLYGAPSTIPFGLDFDPRSFVASSGNGGVDFTDGQLNFTMVNGAGITDISLFESGDYELAGIGTPATQVGASAFLSAAITQINGVNVAPINLVPAFASFGDALPPDVPVGAWSVAVALDVASQLGPNQRATRLEVAINNRLRAISETGTGAFIAKKQFTIDFEIVPEPATAVLIALAFGMLGLVSRSR